MSVRPIDQRLYDDAAIRAKRLEAQREEKNKQEEAAVKALCRHTTMDDRSAKLAMHLGGLDARMENKNRMRDRWLKQRQEEALAVELGHCTGEPQISRAAARLDREYADLVEWDLQRRQRMRVALQHAWQDEVRQCTFNPRVSPGTRMINSWTDVNNETPVHERLHQDARARQLEYAEFQRTRPKYFVHSPRPVSATPRGTRPSSARVEPHKGTPSSPSQNMTKFSDFIQEIDRAIQGKPRLGRMQSSQPDTDMDTTARNKGNDSVDRRIAGRASNPLWPVARQAVSVRSARKVRKNKEYSPQPRQSARIRSKASHFHGSISEQSGSHSPVGPRKHSQSKVTITGGTNVINYPSDFEDLMPRVQPQDTSHWY